MKKQFDIKKLVLLNLPYLLMGLFATDALTAAFTEYTSKKVKKAEKTERPSVLAKLSQFKEMVKNAVVDRTKRKELER